MIRSASSATPYRTEFTNGTHAATADVPVEKGGAGRGFGPHELLEAALATCMTISVEKAARTHGFPLAAVACEVRIDRSFPGTVTLNYHLTLDGPLTAEQRAALNEAARDCPVGRTLTGAIAVRPAGSDKEEP